MIQQGLNLDMLQQEYLQDLIRIVYPSVKVNDIVPFSSNNLVDITGKNIYYGYVSNIDRDSYATVYQNGIFKEGGIPSQHLVLFDKTYFTFLEVGELPVAGDGVAFIGFRASVENPPTLAGVDPPPTIEPVPPAKIYKVLYSWNTDNNFASPCMNVFANHLDEERSIYVTNVDPDNFTLDFSDMVPNALNNVDLFFKDALGNFTGKTLKFQPFITGPVYGAIETSIDCVGDIKPYNFAGSFDLPDTPLNKYARFNVTEKCDIKIERRTIAGTWTNVYEQVNQFPDSLNMPWGTTLHNMFRVTIGYRGVWATFKFWHNL